MRLDHLNPQQLEAVKTIQGAVLVLAGAGTGKTSVITHRIGWMVENGIPPENILAVTFTNKASQEMKQRLAQLLPRLDKDALAVSTFHSFCCRVLRRDIHHLGYDRRFGIADAGDQEGLLKQVVGELGLTGGDLDLNFFRNGISHAKNHLQSVAEIRAQKRDWAKYLADAYEVYQRHLKDMNLVDFDDLLLLPLDLWQGNAELLGRYRERYQYILVDEYQDTNRVQSELIRMLAGERRNVCVVGDDDQSIYGWRGADIANILEFADAYRGAKVIKLEQNYRSTNAILAAASAVIRHNERRHDKTLWSDKPEGQILRAIMADNETDEAAMVGRLIQEAYAAGARYEEMAVLFRSNFQTRPFEENLRDARIPYRLVGAKSFYERREIKDAAAYLRIIHNPRDDLSLLRIINVPTRGLGSKALSQLRDHQVVTSQPLSACLRSELLKQELGVNARAGIEAFTRACDDAAASFAEPGQLADKLQRYLDDVGYLSGLGRVYKNRDEALKRQDNVLEFLDAARVFEERQAGPVSLQEFLEAFALADDSDRVDDRSDDGDGVTLLTIHAAKGLEFPRVFIVGMEQKLFPHERSLDEYRLDEERRLFYVAVTRAQTHLVLTRAKRRTRYNKTYFTQLSQFVSELPDAYLEIVDKGSLFEPASNDQIEDALARMRAWE